MPPELGILSDDITGGLLVASLLEADGVFCPVYMSPTHIPAGDVAAPVVVIAGRTRLKEVGAAMTEVRTAFDTLDRLGCKQLAYKACGTFDSTPEGNIGPVADFLADRYEQVPMVLSAGFPEARVTVFEGHMFVGSELVNESSKRFDPVTPMEDPNLVRFLSLQTQTPVGLLRHRHLVQGPDVAAEILAGLATEGFRHVLLDAADVNDIGVSAKLVARHRAFVASDSLIVAAGKQAGRRQVQETIPIRHAAGPAAVIAGSVGPIAEEQLAVFGSVHPVLRIDLTDPRDPEALADTVLADASALIGKPFAVTTCTDHAGVKAAQARYGRLGSARRGEAVLAAVASRLHERGVRQFVVSGGETSGAVVEALKIKKVRVLPFGPLGGGFCLAESPEHLSLFLKSGKLGEPDVLLRGVEEMAR